jgi:methyltransferase (TIGR00027 family)
MLTPSPRLAPRASRRVPYALRRPEAAPHAFRVQGRAASRTAVLVCQGRAVADGRMAPDCFADPVAQLLLTPEEQADVQRARDDTPPPATRERLAWERLRACAEGMVPRTVRIDDAVRAAGHHQLVIVGAGLDTRPWRLGELAETRLFAVDHPASQADCRLRTAGLVPVADRLELVPVELGSEPLGSALSQAGHDPAVPTTWLWEGVVPYLTSEQVEETLGALDDGSAAGSTIAVQYQERSVIARIGRRLSAFAARRTGLDDPLTDEPWRSLWTAEQMAALLGRHGFRVDSDEDLLTTAARIGSPATHRRSLANGRVAAGTHR